MFSVVSRAPKGQLRVRFPQGTFKFSGNEDGFIAFFYFMVLAGTGKSRRLSGMIDKEQTFYRLF